MHSIHDYKTALHIPKQTNKHHNSLKLKTIYRKWKSQKILKGTDHVGTFMGLKCVVYYANYRSGNQSSKIQVVP